jgi:hypothetical protein
MALLLLRNKAIISIFMNRATGMSAIGHDTITAAQQEEEN